MRLVQALEGRRRPPSGSEEQARSDAARRLKVDAQKSISEGSSRIRFVQQTMEGRPMSATDFTEAISVRQPWAHAIIFHMKDVENRSRVAAQHMVRAIGKRIGIHASKGMTRNEYLAAVEFMRDIGVTPPAPHLLARGGIIGSVVVTSIVNSNMTDSKWWMGPSGLLLKDPEPCKFIGCRGELGLFGVEPNGTAPDAPAHWMLDTASSPAETH
jgi:hypothetical protein